MCERKSTMILIISVLPLLILIWGILVFGCIRKKPSTERSKKKQKNSTSTKQKPSTERSKKKQKNSTSTKQNNTVNYRKMTANEETKFKHDLKHYKNETGDDEMKEFYHDLKDNGMIEFGNVASPDFIHKVKSQCIISTLNRNYVTVSVKSKDIEYCLGKKLRKFSGGMASGTTINFNGSNVCQSSCGSTNAGIINLNGSIIRFSPGRIVAQCARQNIVRVSCEKNGRITYIQWCGKRRSIVKIVNSENGTDILKWSPGQSSSISCGGNRDIVLCSGTEMGKMIQEMLKSSTDSSSS